MEWPHKLSVMVGWYAERSSKVLCLLADTKCFVVAFSVSKFGLPV